MSKQKLIEDNMSLVYYLINKYYPTYLHDEDVIQEGMVGLCQAANDYDSDKGKFSTFASYCILNRIKYYFRTISKQFNVLSYDRVIESVEDENLTFLDAIIGSEDVDLGFVNFKMFYDTLSDREQQLIDLSVDNTEVEIGEILGISQPSVSLRKAKIKAKWRKFNGDN